MLFILGQGLILGFAYVAPIGMQNLFVINTAAGGRTAEAFLVASATILFDILLALACFVGIGILIDTLPFVRQGTLAVGCVAVCWIGYTLFTAAPSVGNPREEAVPLVKTLGACFAVTWLNPQAITDGSLLLGGYNASVPDAFEYVFILGFCLASALWFLTLASVTVVFRRRLNPRVLVSINRLCGILLVLFALKLGYGFIVSIL